MDAKPRRRVGISAKLMFLVEVTDEIRSVSPTPQTQRRLLRAVLFNSVVVSLVVSVPSLDSLSLLSFFDAFVHRKTARIDDECH